MFSRWSCRKNSGPAVVTLAFSINTSCLLSLSIDMKSLECGLVAGNNISLQRSLCFDDDVILRDFLQDSQSWELMDCWDLGTVTLH